MAKKISIDEYIEKNKNKTKDKLKIISLVVNGILLIGIIILVVILLTKTVSKKEYDSMLNIKNSAIRSLELQKNSVNANLDHVLNGESMFYVKEKLDFFDENIVFKIKGYGNYYYTYDCMIKKTGNNSYTYWAYNIDAAKANGLKKGGC